MKQYKLLLTGATGKVGQTLIKRLQSDPLYSDWKIRVFCHKRIIPESDRISVFQGNISNRNDISLAMEGISHVVHLATTKEDPSTIMDVAIKGLFWLLEEARKSSTFSRFILIGGDAAVGHCYYHQDEPVTENSNHSAYPGCYALSKVLEEVMLKQYQIQYGLSSVCLRAAWIMEKDDFRYSLRFDEKQFGGPSFIDLIGEDDAKFYHDNNYVPVLCDQNSIPLKRNIVHVEDLVSAILISLKHPNGNHGTFNICMDEPIDYRRVAEYLIRTRGLQSIDIPSTCHSTWLDNSKAKFCLKWRPMYNMERIIEEAWSFKRSKDDPRIVYYPG